MTVVRRRRRHPGVLDQREGQRLADEGLARAESHQREVERRAQYDAVVWLAKNQLLLDSDDVWSLLGNPTSPSAGSALGAVFRAVAKEGLIVPLRTAKKSERPSQHTAFIAQWMSLVYRSEKHTCMPCAVCRALEEHR